MKHVISLFLMLFICNFVHGQVKSDKLQKEQKKTQDIITSIKWSLDRM